MRELRGGLRGFYVFIACIALGVMAIAGVGSVAASLGDGLAREGRTLLGGDVAFSLIQREAKPEEIALPALARQGLGRRRRCAAMARAGDGRLALVELKAVDGAYPMLGELTLEPQMPVADLLAERDGAFGAAADATLLARLDLKIGDRVTRRQRDLPDPQRGRRRARQARRRRRPRPALPGQRSGLRATGLLQPGSLVRWIYRVKLPDNAADERAATALDRRRAQARCREAGWEIRSRGNASPQLERTINRFTQFLTLVGLAALLVGGVGVANAVKSHIDRRRDVIATFKALGATGRDVFTIYLTQVIVLAGDRLGDRARRRRGAALRHRRRCSANCCRCRWCRRCIRMNWRCRFVYGLLTALAFGLWPLGRVHDVPVAALFRETVEQRMAPAALALSRADGRGDRAAGRGRDRACLRQARRRGVRRRPRSWCSRCCAASPPA